MISGPNSKEKDSKHLPCKNRTEGEGSLNNLWRKCKETERRCEMGVQLRTMVWTVAKWWSFEW